MRPFIALVRTVLTSVVLVEDKTDKMFLLANMKLQMEHMKSISEQKINQQNNIEND